jgi:SAM-dependent methyltransferase
MEIKKLNLGSGEFKKEGYINVDWQEFTDPDIIHDLNVLPYPFEDNSFDLIEADHVLEHLNDPFKVMKDLHRMSQDKGTIIIRVPHFSRGFTHAEHKRGFDVSFPLYFDSSFKGGYQGVEFELKKMKLTWFAQKYLKKQVLSFASFYFASILGSVLDFFANASPYFCSRIWCFWFGGFEEVEFHFSCKKK